MSTTDGVRTRTFSWEDPVAAAAAGAQLPGVELIAGIAAGTFPPPPLGRVLDFEIVEAEVGRALFALQPAEWMYNLTGVVHGGVVASLLDSCMGSAVHTTLAPGSRYTTADLQVRFLRAMSEQTGRVLAEGRVLHRGSRTATAEGRVFAEADESLIAHGTSGLVILS